MNNYKFYDTCSLLLKSSDLFENPEDTPVISSITLNELENIKTSANKDEQIKAEARIILHILEDNENNYELIIFTTDMLAAAAERGFETTNDLKILMSAVAFYKNHQQDNFTFITNDLSLKTIAKSFFDSNNISSVLEDEIDYVGFKELILNNEELAKFYTNPQEYPIKLLENEYLVIKNINKEIIDSYKYKDSKLIRLSYSTLDSYQFGQIKPKDVYQKMAIDSLKTNDITLLQGPAGSGKTFLAFGYLFDQKDKGNINKIIIFCNPVVARGAAKLGFYPGDRNEKLLSSSVGQILISKLGDSSEVLRLIEKGELELVPAGDSRGYEVPANSGVYVMEAQNLDINLLKLLLQRVGDQCKVIIDGDRKTQTDMAMYSGANNGMRRMSKIFRGEDIYGEVELQKIYRSKISSIADSM